MKVADGYPEVFSKVKRVLVVLAHPDDMEINCGGLMARLLADDKQVRLVVVTNGDKGTKDKTVDTATFAKQRVAEQYAAGRILGIPDTENFNLQLPDGEVEPSVSNIEKIVYHIRQFRPDLAITHNPDPGVIDFFDRGQWVNHRDHRHTGQVTLDAVYPYSRDRGFFPSQLKEGLRVHKLTKVLLTDSYIKPAVKYFAIDSVLPIKREALKQHLSAFDPTEVDDYLSENLIGEKYFEPLGYYEIY